MTPFHRRFVSGRVVKLSGTLVIPPEQLTSIILLGHEMGFMTRVLEVGIFKRTRTRTVLAPKIVSIPGRSKRMPSFGSTEAMEARKASLVSNVVFKSDQLAEKGGVVDLTPMAVMARDTLWKLPFAQRHELVRSALSSWVPEPPKDGYQISVVVLKDMGTDIRKRLVSLAKLETPVDHLLFDFLEEGLFHLKHNPENLLLVSEDLRFACRLDRSDKRTDTPKKLLAAVMRLEAVIRGSQEADKDEDVAVNGEKTVDSANPSQMSFPEEEHQKLKERLDLGKNVFTTRVSDEQGKYSKGDIVSTPWGQKLEVKSVRTLDGVRQHPFFSELTPEQKKTLSAYDKLDVVELVLPPGEAPDKTEIRRREKIRDLASAQAEVKMPTFSGKAVKLSELTVSTKAPLVQPKRVPGEFSDETIAHPKFSAISLGYIESGVHDRDTAAVLTSISKDPSVPLFVQSIERTDSSDSINIKETLTVKFKGPEGRPTTVHIDVPVLDRDGYMFLNGNKYSVTKQILAKPIIKIRPDEVLVTTAYNKAIIERFGQNASAASSYIRILASKIDKERPSGVKAKLASATASNAKFRSTVEYDDVARTVQSIRTPEAAFIFSRPMLDEELGKTISKKLAERLSEFLSSNPGSHPVGWIGGGSGVVVLSSDGSPVIVSESGESTAKMEESVTESPEDGDLASVIHSAVVAAAPKAGLPSPSVIRRKYAHSRVKMLSQYLPTAVVVGFDLGLLPMMQRAGIGFKTVRRDEYKRGAFSDMDIIEFEDSVLVYNPKRVRHSLLMNGMKDIDTSERSMADFGAGGLGWIDYIADRLGGPGHAKALVNYQASFIDPITRELLEEDGLPTDMAGVLIHASSMLESNEHFDPNDVRCYRIRGPELINTLLYKILHKEMERVRATRESASPQKLMVHQGELIRAIQTASNVEEVPLLNPLLEVSTRGKATWVGAAGGIGSTRAITRSMRSFHPSMHGVFGYYSPDSSEIGVNRTLAYSTAVKDVRGRIDLAAIDKSKAAQILALGELISPFLSQHADPPRIGMQSKQATHTMPILKHTPLLVGSGAEKALAGAIGNTFVYKAKNDGTVVSLDEKTGLAKLRYDDGEVAFIDLSPRSVKNSGGGFYITTQLSLNPGIRPGRKFKAGDALAHDPSYFFPAQDGSTSYKSGLLVRTALAPLDQTFEDSIMITDKLARDTAALVTMSRSVNLGPSVNLQKTAKVGEEVNPDSALAIFENATDDADVSSLLQRVGTEFGEAIEELTKNVARAKYSGKIVEIHTYYSRDLEELSPSLRKFIKEQERIAQERKKAGEGAPVSEPVKTSAPIRVSHGRVGGEVVDGVLIQFLVQIEDVAGPGDKFVVSSPLKGVVSRVFEKGEEPVDESGLNIDYIMSPLSVVSRMTTDVFLSLWSNLVLVDLKKKVTEIYEE